MNVVSRWALLCASLALVACDSSTQTVEVRITPDGYQVGSVQSTLATPAVDEVVRINPKKVLLMSCLGTPPAKTIQFEVELSARSKAQQQGSFTNQGCPA